MTIDNVNFELLMVDIRALCSHNIIMKQSFLIEITKLLDVDFEEAKDIVKILEYLKMIRVQTDQPKECMPKVYIL